MQSYQTTVEYDKWYLQAYDLMNPIAGVLSLRLIRRVWQWVPQLELWIPILMENFVSTGISFSTERPQANTHGYNFQIL